MLCLRIASSSNLANFLAITQIPNISISSTAASKIVQIQQALLSLCEFLRDLWLEGNHLNGGVLGSVGGSHDHQNLPKPTSNHRASQP